MGKRSTGEPPGNALYNHGNAVTLQQQLLEELGGVEFCDIEVCPFSFESHDTIFGLIAEPPEDGDEDEEWTVIAEPGNYMAFYPPWDGEYDT